MLATLLFRWWIIVNHKLCIVDLGVVIHISHYLVITPLMPHCARPQPCHQLRPLDLTGTHPKGTNVAPQGCSRGKLERQRRKVRGQAHGKRKTKGRSQKGPGKSRVDLAKAAAAFDATTTAMGSTTPTTTMNQQGSWMVPTCSWQKKIKENQQPTNDGWLSNCHDGWWWLKPNS